MAFRVMTFDKETQVNFTIRFQKGQTRTEFSLAPTDRRLHGSHDPVQGEGTSRVNQPHLRTRRGQVE